MREIRVYLDEGHAVAVITLPVGLYDLMSSGVSYPWGTGLLEARSGTALCLHLPEEEAGKDLWDLLSGLQSGLLMLALSKARLLEPDAHQPFPDLYKVASGSEVQLSGGETAFLAFWDRSATLAVALRIASDQGLAHFVLQKGRAKNRPRLSILLPHKMRDWGLEQVTKVQVLRLTPRFLYGEAETAEGDAPPSLQAALAEIGPVSEWEDPFWDLFGRDADTPPPVTLLDRISEKACRRLLDPPLTGFSRSPTLRALSWAWAIGAGGADGSDLRRLRPPVRTHNRLRERARLIDEIAEEGDADLLRMLSRVSALQAWRIGHEGRGGVVWAPQGTFFEERDSGLRDLTPAAQESILRIHEGRRVEHRFRPALNELLKAGLIENVKTRALTALGAELLRSSLERPQDAPSIRQISQPNEAVMRTLKVVPDTTEPPIPLAGPERGDGGWTEPFLDLLIAGTGVPCPVGDLERSAERAIREIADPDLTRKRFHRALTRAYQMGRGGAMGKDQKIPASPLITGFLRERSRALETLIGPEGPPEQLTTLLRVSSLQAWRIGVETTLHRFGWLDSLFREEGPRELWPVSPEARDLLRRVRSGRPGPVPDEAAGELAREGLILSATELAVTDLGLTGLKKWDRLKRAPSLLELTEGRHRAMVLLRSQVRRPSPPKRPRPERRAAKPVEKAPQDPRPPRALTDSEVAAVRSEKELFTLLTGSWSEGRYGPDDGTGARHRSVPIVISLFLAERARAIWEATGADREDGGHDLIRSLIRDQADAAFRLGTRTPSKNVPAPPAEFGDECSVPMRSLSPPLRDLLIGLYQEEITWGLPAGAGPALRTKGLLVGTRPGHLTDAGRDLARAELEHRSRTLPSIRPGGRRAHPAPASQTQNSQAQDPAPRVIETPPEASRGTGPGRPEVTPGFGEVLIGEEDFARISSIIERARLPKVASGERSVARLTSALNQVLTDCFRAGAGREEARAGSIGPTRVLFYVRDRARIIAEAGVGAGAEVIGPLLLDSGTEMFRIGLQVRRRTLLDLSPRFAEECSEQMRRVPHEARETLIRAAGRKPGRLSAESRRVLQRLGMLWTGDKVQVTPLGASLVEAELAARGEERPPLLSVLDR